MQSEGAPTVTRGTASAMDQGIIGAVTTAVFSRSEGKLGFIIFQRVTDLAGQHNGQGLIAGNVPAKRDTRRIAAKGEIFSLSWIMRCWILSRNPVPSNIPEKLEEMQTMPITLNMEISPPPP